LRPPIPTQSLAPRTEGPRLHELDSLRGLAAICVVFTHFHDMWSPYSLANLPPHDLWKLLVLSPFYTGHEAVILFFLLSGLVLSLPYLRGKQQSYLPFVARRIVRIYGPYLAAILLAIAGAAIWHNHAYHGEWAAHLWSTPVSLKLVTEHIAFLGVYDWHQFDFAIWSLVHELRISIVFPLLFLLVSRTGKSVAILFAICSTAAALALISGKTDTSIVSQ
jgi:peptidoglycan/LPS O-acetylase OafA/YrhL